MTDKKKTENDIVLMRVSNEFRDWLDTLKIIERQTYSDICDRIKRLLENDKDIKEKLNAEVES